MEEEGQRFWVHPWLSADRRLQFGHNENNQDGRQHCIAKLYQQKPHMCNDIQHRVVLKSRSVTPVSEEHLSLIYGLGD